MTTPEMIDRLRSMSDQILTKRSKGKDFFEECADRLSRYETMRESIIAQLKEPVFKHHIATALKLLQDHDL